MRTFSTSINFFRNQIFIDTDQLGSPSYWDSLADHICNNVCEVLELNEDQRVQVLDIIVGYKSPCLTSFRLLSETSTPSDYRRVLELRRFLRGVAYSSDSFFLANLNSGECILITSLISN